MRAEDFFALKIRRFRPGLNPQTWVLKASTLSLDHRNRSIRCKDTYYLKEQAVPWSQAVSGPSRNPTAWFQARASPREMCGAQSDIVTAFSLVFPS